MPANISFLRKMLLPFALFSISGVVHSVEPLSDSEMSEAIVLDPFGATAAGGYVDTTLAGSEESALSSDESNQTLATDPNNKAPINTAQDFSGALEIGGVKHTTKNIPDGIQINSVGTVNRVFVEQIIDNTGANRGSRSIENINTNTTANIHSFR